MKDHFDTVCKDVYQDIQTGNQSGKEGDLSEKYNLVQSIMTETDEAEALKEGKKAEKEELQEKLELPVLPKQYLTEPSTMQTRILLSGLK